MKSLMEEASSIAKAIEKAWERANSPREFTIKVLDKPEKNFFGFTTRSAKVAILFEEEAPQAGQTHRYNKKEQKYTAKQPTQRYQAQQKKAPEQTKKYPQEERQSTQKNKKIPESTSASTTQPIQKPVQKVREPIWNPDRVEFVGQWITNMLKAMGLDHIKREITTDRNAIRIVFEKQLTQDSEQEKQLFRSWAYLIMQSLRNAYKQPFKHIKVILKSDL